jgi:hypothetical protein
MTWTFAWRSRTSRTALAKFDPSRVDPAQSSAGLPREATYLGTS